MNGFCGEFMSAVSTLPHDLPTPNPRRRLSLLHASLAKNVAAAQLEKVLWHEAEEAGAMERCVKHLLVRRLHEKLPEGWHREWDEDANFRRAHAYGSWCAYIPSRYDQSLDRTGDVIKTASLPEGWLLAGPDDPILVEIFREHWREAEQEVPEE